VGNVIYQKIGKRACTVFLHSPWSSMAGYDKPDVLPVDGYIDSLIGELPNRYHRIGFDVNGSPFGQLPSETSLYKLGYDDFTLSDFCDGYIYQCSFADMEPVTTLKDFITESNLLYAQSQSGDPDAQNASVDYFYSEMVKSADLKSKFSSILKNNHMRPNQALKLTE
jgi:hypothetical protein